MHFSIGISLVDETVAEPEVPSEQEKQLTQGIQFAYTVPSNDTSQAQEVCTTYVGVGWRGARGVNGGRPRSLTSTDINPFIYGGCAVDP